MSTFVREETNIKKIISYLYISIIPLLIFGFYKNGIKSYDGIYILHPLILDLVGFASGTVVSIILEKKKPLTSFYPFYGLLSASLVFPNTSIIVFGLICFISLFIYKKINKNNVNIVCVIALIVILISNFYETSYLNLVINSNTNLDGLDYLLGKGSAGLNASCTLLSLASYLYLSTKAFYKREIPFYIVITYFIVSLGFGMFTHDIKDALKLMLSNEVLFPSIYVATVSIASPILNNKKIIYGVGIGILGFILARFMGKEGIYVAIVIMNIILIILEKLGEVVAKKS